MSNTTAVTAVTAVIDSVFASTKKNFIAFDAVEELLPAAGVRIKDGGMFYGKTGYKWKTMVISEHGFQKQYQAMYKKQAAKNISKIYYGKGGFKNYDVGGGCCYVLVRK